MIRTAVQLMLPAMLLAHAMQAQGVEVRTGRIRVGFDDKLRRTVQWTGATAGSIVAFDPAVQDGVQVSGVMCAAFELQPARTVQRRVESPEFGAALELTVAGEYADPERELRIERTVSVMLPERFPDVVLMRSTYRNAGSRPIHVEAVLSQQLVLDRQIAEPKQPSFAFASFQGGAYRWGDEYAVIRLGPGFRQSNFQGVDDVTGAEGTGGGMPLTAIWSPAMGVAIAHLEKTPQWVSLPVAVRADGKVTAGISESPLAKFRQAEWLKPGQSYSTVLSASIFHRGDFFDALQIYGNLLRARGVAIPKTSPRSAYQPYWKTWGYERDFTLTHFLDKLPELAAMGIRMASLDDGWQNNVGDWEPAATAGKFPRGADDIAAFVREVHRRGFRVGIWWYPAGVSPESNLARERPDLLVRGENGEYPRDPNGFYQLCPAYEPALARIGAVVSKIAGVWGFDGVYSDLPGLSAVPPCFNAAHDHQSPLESFQSVPKIFETISRKLHELKADPYNEVCICSLPHSPYNMPYYDIANASDPMSPWQVRSRIKVEKAIRGGTFAVGDCYQVPMHEWYGASAPEAFESAIGTGGQLTTFYRSLDERQTALWQRWFGEYAELGLSSAEYVNHYDLAFDKPEGHVVRKGSDIYFAFFADYWPQTRAIELRGLDPQQTYEVYDYANRTGPVKISGAKPTIRRGFKESLLLRVRPVGGTANESRAGARNP